MTVKAEDIKPGTVVGRDRSQRYYTVLRIVPHDNKYEVLLEVEFSDGGIAKRLFERGMDVPVLEAAQ